MKKEITRTEEIYFCEGCGTELGNTPDWKCGHCDGDVGVCCGIVVEITKWDNPNFETGTNPEKIKKYYHPKCWNDFDKNLP